jgi:hypothetical protein
LLLRFVLLGGALTINTRVHNIELEPGQGGVFCRAAGSAGKIVNKINDRIIIKLPSEQEISVNKNCMVTVGQASHSGKKSEKMTHPVDKRDLGYRPSSGFHTKKDGYCGRKVKPPKEIKVMNGLKPRQKHMLRYTYDNWSLTE